jgi:hypothetical protein
MKPIKAKRLNFGDHNDRPLAEDADGSIYIDVNCAAWFLVDSKTHLPEAWHTVTNMGEPDHPVYLVFEEE